MSGQGEQPRRTVKVRLDGGVFTGLDVSVPFTRDGRAPQWIDYAGERFQLSREPTEMTSAVYRMRV